MQNPNGSHESLTSSEDIDSRSLECNLDIMECLYCNATTEDGCDCVLGEEEESSSSGEDYETESDEEERYIPSPSVDIQVRRFVYIDLPPRIQRPLPSRI